MDVALTVESPTMSGRLRLRSSTGEEAASVVCALPPRVASAPVAVGPQILEGPGTLDGTPLLDLGTAGLGERAWASLTVRNRGPGPVHLGRCFAGGLDELEIEFQPTVLPSGGEAEIRIGTRGVDRPGTRRRFVHLFTDHPEAKHVQIACAGTVLPPPRRPSLAEPVTVTWIPAGSGPPLVEIRDRAGTVRAVSVADHDALRASEPSPGNPAVCSNALPGSAGWSPDARPPGLAHPVRVLSVAGDEAVDGSWVPHLGRFGDPGGTIVEAIHDPGDSDRPSFDGLTVAVFHDHSPPVREAARRTRVPALFVAAGERGRSVERARDVVVWSLDPARRDSLTLHVHGGTILAVDSPPPTDRAGVEP